MNNTQLIGVSVFSLGILLILGFSFFELFLKATELPEIIKYGLLLIFLGILVMLISLSVERIKEMKK